MMNVSKSGYYKWLSRPDNPRKVKRGKLVEIVEAEHTKHPSHGYRWMAAYIRLNYSYDFTDNFIYTIFKQLNIRAETKHKAKSKPRKVKDRYPNLVYTSWEYVDRPRQVIVSDMTVLHVRYFYIELTMYFDVFTKQIVAHRIGERRGDRYQYINGLIDVVELLEKERIWDEPTILHTDQGSVYASIAYNDLIKDKNIIRSMSRAGTPTDNPVNETLNGWIKEELYMDFKIGDCSSREEIIEAIDRYVGFYNAKRPCYAIGYDIPDRYYEKYINGEMKRKDTFKDRVLDPTPKFVKKRKAEKQEVVKRLIYLLERITGLKG